VSRIELDCSAQRSATDCGELFPNCLISPSLVSRSMSPMMLRCCLAFISRTKSSAVSVEDIDAAFVVKDGSGQKEPGRRSAAKLLTKDEARRIAANIAKLPRSSVPRSSCTVSGGALL